MVIAGKASKNVYELKKANNKRLIIKKNLVDPIK